MHGNSEAKYSRTYRRINMVWRHFEAWQSGTAYITGGGRDFDCHYDIGTITTGKQRVFHRFYISVVLLDGNTVVGEDPYNVLSALYVLDRELRNRGMTLLVAGLDDQFRESGLSANSGYGYLPNIDRAIHVMDTPPPRQPDRYLEDAALDAMIREAVDGMFAGGIVLPRGISH